MTPLKVLVFCASPTDRARLEVAEEVSKIQQRIRVAEHGNSVLVTWHPAAKPCELQEILMRDKPDIVHFSGHGEAGEIILENDDHTARPVTKEALAGLFKVVQEFLGGRIQAVVLNACYAAAQVEGIMEHVDYVVGMSHDIADDAAIAFSAGFYGAIANKVPPAKAFEHGKVEVHILRPAMAEIPQLRCRPDVLPPVRVLVHLDLDTRNPIPDRDIRKRLPEKPDHTLALSQFGVSPSHDGSDVDWPACARAIRAIHDEARARVPTGRAIHYDVVGRAALPVFALLGIQLDARASVTLLNRRRDDHQTWDVLPLDGAPRPPEGPFFHSIQGLDQPCDNEGRIAVFVSTSHPLVTDRIVSFIQGQGDRLAGIVALQAGGQNEAMLDEARAPAAMAELTDAFKRLTITYPRRTGLALFVSGPATLAFMAGRALSPRVIRDIWLPNYDGDAYRPALTLGGADPG